MKYILQSMAICGFCVGCTPVEWKKEAPPEAVQLRALAQVARETERQAIKARGQPAVPPELNVSFERLRERLSATEAAQPGIATQRSATFRAPLSASSNLESLAKEAATLVIDAEAKAAQITSERGRELSLGETVTMDRNKKVTRDVLSIMNTPAEVEAKLEDPSMITDGENALIDAKKDDIADATKGFFGLM